MVENNNDIFDLLWLDNNGGIDSIAKRLMPNGYEWPAYEDGCLVKIGSLFVDTMGNIDIVEYISFEAYNYFSLHGKNGTSVYQIGERVKSPVVKGKDSRTICIGETVYGQDGKEWLVTGFNYNSSHSVKGKNSDCIRDLKPEWLSHEKPMTPEDIEGYLESNAMDYLMPYSNGMWKDVKLVSLDVVENAMCMLHEFYKNNKNNMSIWL